MQRLFLFIIMIATLIFLSSCSANNQAAGSGDLESQAKGFINQLAKGNYQAAVSKFDDTMKAVSPPNKLEELWKSLTAQFGAFKNTDNVRIEKVGPYDSVIVACVFEKQRVGIKVVYDQQKQITGLWIVPAEEASKQTPPPYANPASYEEKQVTVGSGEWALPGTLTMPEGNGPFPAVVLVHGSGPNDRDETVGANKPFRDLAWGLASKGMAVLRYEKRTKQHGAKMVGIADKITLKEETIDDAVSAVELLRKTEKIDPKRVYVLGHSLGGMAAPRIALADPKIAGLIIMAGTTRPVEDVLLDQLDYITSLDNSDKAKIEAQVKELKKQIAKVKDPNLSTKTPASEMILGASTAYWLDLRNYNPAKTAKSLKQPMLILQGGRDYQATVKDFQGWKAALDSRKNVTFKLYPKLNHLFMEGKGKSTPSEYEIPGHVSEEVVDDIAEWVKG